MCDWVCRELGSGDCVTGCVESWGVETGYVTGYVESWGVETGYVTGYVESWGVETV